MRPETKAKRKIEALERRRALIDHLIEFIRTHPNAVDGADLHPLANRTGLRYDYAVIRPLWDENKNGVVLRLVSLPQIRFRLTKLPPGPTVLLAFFSGER